MVPGNVEGLEARIDYLAGYGELEYVLIQAHVRIYIFRLE
jgi:hypothetical protein